MQVWQVAFRDFNSINHHHNSVVLPIHVHIAVEKQFKYM